MAASTGTERIREHSDEELHEQLQILESADQCTREKCNEIYPHDHIKQRVGDERILGTLDQFCAAFYHVPDGESEENNAREYVCLDQKNCIIAQEWNAQPKAGVAFVKFENHRGKILYEARYTYCASGNMHAENFFKKDIKNGVFKELVQDNPKGSITLYLTLQLSNCAAGTGTEHSFSITLKEIVPILKDKQEIKLCIKAARINQPQRPDSDDPNNVLEVNENEINELMDLGVKFSGMTQYDWDYLFTLTKDNQDRKHLDQEVESIFRKIEKNQE